MWDVIIIGGGPAGLSCALLLGRCCRRVLVIDAGAPRNARVPAVSGFLSRDGTPPGELRALARAEVERYGVVVREGCVEDVTGPAPWVVRTATESASARALVLATGVMDELPTIQGVGPFWGRSVVTCPLCDAWEHRGAALAVYGWDADSADAALGLLTWSADVTLCSDGRPPPEDPRLARHGVVVIPSPILRLEGRAELESITFTDGSRRRCDVLFVHAGQRPPQPFAELLGCSATPNGCIQVDAEGRTGVDGLWACGDAATGPQLAIEAAAEGARAALCINRTLRREDLA